jgi:hypothetical protein
MKFAGGVECLPVMNAAGLEVVGPPAVVTVVFCADTRVCCVLHDNNK